MVQMRFAAVVAPLVLAAAVAAVWVSPVAAQQSTGPLEVDRHTDFDLDVETLYDSNVSRSDLEIAKLRGLTLADVITTPSVLVDVSRRLAGQLVYLNGTTGYDFYARNSVLNRERIDLHAGANGRLLHCQDALTGGYSRHQVDLDDLVQTVTRDVEQHESVGVALTCGHAVGLAPNLSVSENWDSHDAEILRTSDYKSFSATGGLGYRRPTFGELSLFGQFTEADFSNRLIITPAGSAHDGYDLYSGGASFDRHLGGRIEGTFSASYTSLKPFSALAPGFSGPTYATDAKFRATRKLHAHASFTRAVLPATQIGATFNVDQLLLVEVNYAASSRLTATLGVSQDHRRLNGEAIIPGVDLLNQRTRDAYATLNFLLTRRVTLGLDARYEVRDTNLIGYSYSGERVGISVKGHF